MFERLFHRDFADRFQRPGAKRPARCGQHDAAKIFAPACAQCLEDRIVLGIDRQHGGAAGRCAAHEQRAGADETFLVGERDRCAAFGRGKRRREARGAGDRRHDPLGGPLRGFNDGAPRRPPLRCRSRTVRS